MPAHAVVEHLRDHLVANGLGRVPRLAGTSPPLWADPRNGVPAPGESMGAAVEMDPDLVVGLFRATGIVTPPHEGFIRRVHVDVRIRARQAPLAYEWEAQLRDLINDKRGWDMAGLPVNESYQFRELQPVGSDNQGFDYVTEYGFWVWS